MNKQLLNLIKQKQNKIYSDPKSIFMEYDVYLKNNGIYRSCNNDLFFRTIKNKFYLCEFTLRMYEKAIYDNERLFLLDCLLKMGYNRCLLIEMVLKVFETDKNNAMLWEYADFLYELKNFEYLNNYLKIITDSSYGASRQMLVLLVGKSKKNSVIPILKSLLCDSSVCGHALEALSNFQGDEIDDIMKQYINFDVIWIQKIAKKYLRFNTD